MDNIKISVKKNLVLAHFDEHINLLRTMLSLHVKRTVTLTEDSDKVQELLDSGH